MGVSLRNAWGVILAWNHYDDTRACLQSFSHLTSHGFHIIVVDNNSSDGTFDKITTEFPEVCVLRSEKNLGVAGGYNLGIEYALQHDAEFVLIANNDIVIHSEMVVSLIKFSKKRPDAGIIMPKIYHYYGNKNRIWIIGARWRTFPPSVKLIAYNQIDKGQFEQPLSIEYAPSCCYLIRRSAVERVGLFDPEYFFYFDDWDYSLRMRRAGFTIWMVPTARMWHKVSVSTQRSEKPYTWWKQMGRSTYRFYNKYFSKWQLALYTIWFFIREIIKLKPVHSIAFIEGLSEMMLTSRSHLV